MWVTMADSEIGLGIAGLFLNAKATPELGVFE